MLPLPRTCGVGKWVQTHPTSTCDIGGRGSLAVAHPMCLFPMSE